MIHIRIDPFLVRLGPVTVAWHGLWVAAGALVGFLVFLRKGRRKEIERDELLHLILWVLVSGYVGARLLQVLYDWDLYATQPPPMLANS